MVLNLAPRRNHLELSERKSVFGKLAMFRLKQTATLPDAVGFLTALTVLTRLTALVLRAKRLER